MDVDLARSVAWVNWRLNDFFMSFMNVLYFQIDEYSQEINIEEPLSHPHAKEWDNLPMSHAKQYLFKHECNHYFFLYFLPSFFLFIISIVTVASFWSVQYL